MYDKKNIKRIASTIEMLVEERNTTQKEIGNKANILPSKISKMKKEPYSITIEDLADLANALEVDIDVLLGIDRANDFVVNFVREFTRITTTDEYSASNDGIYNVEDAILERKGDYLVLTGNKSLFVLIKDIAHIENIKNNEKKYLSRYDYNEMIKKAKDKYESDKSNSTDQNYFLISAQEMARIIEQDVSNQAYVEQLFKKLGITSPLDE